MFATLSRGSSRVRQAYICSSCLGNALKQSCPAVPLAADRYQRVAASYYSTSTDAKADNGSIQPIEALIESAEDSKIADTVNAANGADEKPAKEGKKRRPRKKLTGAALKALRQSLALIADGADGKPAEEEKKPKDREKLSGAALRVARKLEPQKGMKKGKKSEAEDANKDSAKVAKSKKETAEASEPTAESAEPTSKEFPVRKVHVNLPNDARFARINEQLERRSKEVASLETDNNDSNSQKPDTFDQARTKAFLEKHPSIQKKLSEYLDKFMAAKEDASGAHGKAGPPSNKKTRRSLVNLIQSGQLSTKEKYVTMALLKSTLLNKHKTNRGLPIRQRLVGKTLESRKISAERSSAATTGRPTGAGIRGMKSSTPMRQRASRPRPTNPPSRATRVPRASNSRSGPLVAHAGTTSHEIKTIKANTLQLIPLDKDKVEVPNLAYGLERVLFNPGVYHLQDPRSRVFNFDPYLQTIMPVSEFDFNALKQYITSSRDKTLLSKAKEEEKKYTGSTSSMTSALGHFHFLLSQWRPINTGILSQMFPVEYNTFTALQRGPVAVFLRWRDGTYAIDADKEYDQSNILMMLGKSMEKLLTLSTDDFERYRKQNSDQISEEERNESESFHYTTMGDFLLRSQLDAHDSRLPGTGMFDLKTRAVVGVRMDIDAFEEGKGYQIRGRHGEWESFEREYYDMIRAAFLKYSLQVRMGRMDGIFVAFHNTERIFGFQYISLPEMDYALHGTDNTAIGDSEFKLSLELLNRVLDRATAKFPKQSLRLHFETRPGVTPFMYIFAEPVEERVVEEIQATNKQKIEEFEREVLGLATSKLTEEEKEAEWAKLRAKVEERMQEDELGLESAAGEAGAKGEAEVDKFCIEEQLEEEELLASAALEDGEHDDNDGEDEDVIMVEDGEDDDDSVEEEGEDHEESEERMLEDGDEDLEHSEDDEQAILDETLADDAEDPEEHLSADLEDAEKSENIEEQDPDEQQAAEQLSDDLDDVDVLEEQDLDEEDAAEKNLSDDIEDAEESESLQEQDAEEQMSAEDIVAQDLEEAGRLEESGLEDEILDEEDSIDDDLVSLEWEDEKTESAEQRGTKIGEHTGDYTLEEALARAGATSATHPDVTSGSGTQQNQRARKRRLQTIAKKAREAAEAAEQKSNFELGRAKDIEMVKKRLEKEAKKTEKASNAEAPQPLLAMTLVIRNKVNGDYVERPEQLEGKEKWEVEYALSEIPKLESAHRLYEMTKTRRWKTLSAKSKDKDNAWNNMYIANIKKMSAKGREWRNKQDKIEKKLPLKVLGVKEGKKMKDKDMNVWGQGSKEDEEE